MIGCEHARCTGTHWLHRVTRFALCAGAVAVFQVPVAAHADAETMGSISGLVVRVVDGDTLEIEDGRDSPISIRLAQIDAPESTQPYGGRSSEALSVLTLGKLVRADIVDRDRYGRSVAEVHVEGLHVNAEMVRLGHAWAYTRYARSVEIIELEDEARREGRGLWKLPLEDRDAPWIWRAEKRAHSRASSEPREAADRSCGSKRTCKEMVSCAEARFYHRTCQLDHLDGDGDGTPCESICRP